MKFTDGLMIHTGHPVTEYVDTAVRHVLLRQGMDAQKIFERRTYFSRIHFVIFPQIKISCNKNFQN